MFRFKVLNFVFARRVFRYMFPDSSRTVSSRMAVFSVRFSWHQHNSFGNHCNAIHGIILLDLENTTEHTALLLGDFGL